MSEPVFEKGKVALELGFTSRPELVNVFFSKQETPKQTVKPVGLDLNSDSAFPSLGAPSSTHVRQLTAIRRVTPANASVQEVLDLSVNAQARKTAEYGGPTPLDVLKDIQQRTNTDIDLSISKKTGTMTFLVRGKPEAVKNARRLIFDKFATDVRTELLVPASCRPHIVGAGGKTLKAIIEKSGAKIDIPRLSEKELEVLAANKGLPQSEMLQPVELSGGREAVSIARAEIEGIVAQRTSHTMGKISLERSFLPLMASKIAELSGELPVRIHTPPTVTFSKTNAGISGEVSITIIGERQAVSETVRQLESLSKMLAQTTTSLVITVRKRAHRYVVGSKGSNLARILELTGCALDLPPSNDPSEQITIRGREDKIPDALRLVLEAANSVTFEVLPLNFLPASCNAKLLVLYIVARHKLKLREIEQKHSVTISSPENYTAQPLADKPEDALVFEIQGNDTEKTSNARRELKLWLKAITDTEYFAPLKIRKSLVKFVVGRQGSNLAKLRADPKFTDGLADILLGPFVSRGDVVDSSSDEETVDGATNGRNDEAEEDAVLVCKRQAFRNQKEADAFVEAVWQVVVKEAAQSADITTATVDVDPKFRPRLLAKGSDDGEPVYKSLLHACNVNAKYLFRDGKLQVSGKAADVAKAVALVEKSLKSWTLLKSLHSQTILFSANVLRRLFGNVRGDVPLANVSWLYKQARESLNVGSDLEAANKEEASLLESILSVLPESNEVIVSGLESVVKVLVSILEKRANFVEFAAEDSVNLLDLVFKQMQIAPLEDAEQVDRAFRRAIGKEFRHVKKVQENHNVRIDFGNNATAGDSATERWNAVSIKGLPETLTAARDELVGMVVDELKRSYRSTIRTSKSIIPALLGKGGVRFKELKQKYPCSIDFLPSSDPEYETVSIEGFKENVERVCSELTEQIELLCSSVTDVLKVPEKFSRVILWSNRETIKNLTTELNARVKFGEDGVISMSAPAELMPRVRAEVVKLVGNFFNSPTGFDGTVYSGECTIARRDIPHIVSKGGKGLRELQQQFNVHIRIENGDDTKEAVPVCIYGASQEAVDAAVLELKKKERAFESLQLPKVFDNAYETKHEAVIEAENSRILGALRQNSNLRELQFEVNVFPKGGNPRLSVFGDKTTLSRSLEAIKAFVDTLEPVTYVHCVPVPTYVWPHIIGRAGSRLKQIETDHAANLVIVRSEKSRDGGSGSRLDSDYCLLKPADSELADHSLDAALALVNRIIADQREIYEAEQLEKAERATKVSSSGVKADSHAFELRTSKRSVPGYSSAMRSNVKKQHSYGIASRGSESELSYCAPLFNAADASGNNTKWKVVGGEKPGVNQTNLKVPNGNVAPSSETGAVASSGKKKKSKKSGGTAKATF